MAGLDRALIRVGPDEDPADILAPRTGEYVSTVLTEAARRQARDDVPPQYDFTAAQAEAIADYLLELD